MPMTNALTAQAATQPAPLPRNRKTLIGVFTAPDGDHILLRTTDGAIVKLEQDTPQDGLTLMQTGDGWAMIRDGAKVERLIIG